VSDHSTQELAENETCHSVLRDEIHSLQRGLTAGRRAGKVLQWRVEDAPINCYQVTICWRMGAMPVVY
jgi:hypothetical protein